MCRSTIIRICKRSAPRFAEGRPAALPSQGSHMVGGLGSSKRDNLPYVPTLSFMTRSFGHVRHMRDEP